MVTQVLITCKGQLPVVDTPPQPAEPPAGTLTDTLMSLPQRSASINTQTQIQLNHCFTEILISVHKFKDFTTWTLRALEQTLDHTDRLLHHTVSYS